MKVILAGRKINVFPNAEAILDNIPVAFYSVVPPSMVSPAYLYREDDLTEPPHKIYGDVNDRIERIFKRHTFAISRGNSNTGAVLSGQKGSGKSVLLRKFSLEAVKRGYPVITVDQYVPGLSDLLAQIKQPCVIVFDEFEKTFAETEQQNEILTILDGASGKNGHMFMFAINEANRVSSYLFNRPGRVHYHYRYMPLEEEIIREYIQDNVVDQSRVNEAVAICRRIDCTFDILQALVYEINEGYSIEDISTALNVTVKDGFQAVVTFADGSQTKTYGRNKRDFYITGTSLEYPNRYFDESEPEDSHNTKTLITFPDRYNLEHMTLGINPETGNEFVDLTSKHDRERLRNAIRYSNSRGNDTEVSNLMLDHIMSIELVYEFDHYDYKSF